MEGAEGSGDIELRLRKIGGILTCKVIQSFRSKLKAIAILIVPVIENSILRNKFVKVRLLIIPVQLTIACAFMLTAYSLGQDRGGMPPGDGYMIGRVFSKEDASGSLEYWGVCNFKELYPDFPKLKRISGHEGSAVELLREIFSVNPYMKVSQDADGKIRMVEEDVPTDLLDVKIDHIQFPVKYTGPDAAILAIMHTPEVRDFLSKHNVGPAPNLGDIAGYSRQDYNAPMRRVYGNLHDVTVRQALDYVLGRFHGFWFYENCKSTEGGRIVFFGFIENVPKEFLVQTQK